MIFWPFIAEQEGRRSIGYVPPEGDSGVTIGMGIDLGQMPQSAFDALPMGLQLTLRPYLGLTRSRAEAALERFPLHLSPAELDALEQPTKARIVGALSAHYLADSGVPFPSLPDAAQTVMASVTWQYGATWERCPHFWGACVARDWPQVHHELLHFGDAYGPRRAREAAYLADNLPADLVPQPIPRPTS